MTRLSINGKTLLYGIVGNPVSHSFSPEMHTLAFQHLRLNSVYLPFQIQKHDLPKLLDAFRLTGMQGFNITVPYKEAMMDCLPELSDEAQFIGAVNTVKRTSGGWKGFCTDGTGFIRALKSQMIEIEGAEVLLIGAGGAAKAIAYSLVKCGISKLHIINRTVSKALQLQDRLAQLHGAVELAVNPNGPEHYDLLINSTSIGMKGEKSPVAKDLLLKCKTVVDIVYNPPLTPLLKHAQAAGIPCYNGIDMLLYQGVDAFEIWTGRSAPVEIMRESLKNSLAFVK